MMRSMARLSARLLGNAYDPHPSPILPLQAAPTHDALGCEAPGTWDGPHTGGVDMSDFSQVDWGFSAHTEALDLKRRVDAAEKRLLLMETAIEALVTNLERVLGVLERMKP